jgi:DNA replication licensing factor MCM3
MTDEKDPVLDRKIAERVILNHKYVDNEFRFGRDNNDDHLIESDLMNDSTPSTDSTPIYEMKLKSFFLDNEKEIISRPFFKKYITYAKTTVKPELTDDAIEFLTTAWPELRKKADEFKGTSDRRGKTLPVTVRTLETLIRLSTAHAKLRLSQKVELVDCKLALSLLNYAIFNEDEDDMLDVEEKKVGTPRASTKKGSALRKIMNNDDDDSEEDYEMDTTGTGKKNILKKKVTINEEPVVYSIKPTRAATSNKKVHFNPEEDVATLLGLSQAIDDEIIGGGIS